MNCVGVFDVLTFDNSQTNHLALMPQYQVPCEVDHNLHHTMHFRKYSDPFTLCCSLMLQSTLDAPSIFWPFLALLIVQLKSVTGNRVREGE